MKRLKKWIIVLMAIAAGSTLFATAAYAEAVEFDGIIEPWQVVDIGAPAEGIVAQVLVDRSSTVTQGAVLVTLESSVEQAALEKAQAMAAFNGEMDMKQAQLSFAKRVHKRVRKLKAVSAQDKDQAATEVALTRYRLKKAGENKALAEIELKKARAVLARRTIHSTINGVVVERYVSPGEYVNTQPLLRVAQTDPLRVEVILPSNMFGRIRPGMKAEVAPELPVYGPRAATVTIVDQVIDSASNTFGVRLELPNGEDKVPSGLKCLVRFELKGDLNDLKKAGIRIIAGQSRSNLEN